MYERSKSSWNTHIGIRKNIFLANAGPYAGVDNPRAMLAEWVESLVSQEHAKWATVQQQEPQRKPGA
jgi:hypothetical protein